jgi:hypothetical protein
MLKDKKQQKASGQENKNLNSVQAFYDESIETTVTGKYLYTVSFHLHMDYDI